MPTKVALFARSIKKRWVSQMTRPMLEFLATIDRDDPALDEIAEVFPEAVAAHRNNTEPQMRSIVDLIRDGMLTEEHIRANLFEDLTELLNDWRVQMTIFGCTPHQFDILIVHPDIRRFVSNCRFLCDLVNQGRDELIMHMKHNADRLGIDMQAQERNAVMYIVSLAHDVLFSTKHFIPNALRHLTFTAEELRVIWSKCLGVVNLDVVELLDERMTAVP
jgi:hypothetical protein